MHTYRVVVRLDQEEEFTTDSFEQESIFSSVLGFVDVYREWLEGLEGGKCTILSVSRVDA